MPLAKLSRPEQSTRHLFETVATFAMVIALLYFCAGVLVPLVLAVLLAFALTPLADIFGRRLRLPDVVAVLLAVLIAAIALSAFAYLISTQLIHLVEDFPKYHQSFRTKLRLLQSHLGSGILVFQ
jgi:predicted PurR-regulated permease PerM